MKIPRKLKIGGHVVNVIIKDLGKRYDGSSSTNDNSIEIEESLPPSQREATLIHEILHMMNATWAETREGHVLLESISQQIYQVLSDNKLLRK